jgi:RNA polymerase sigma-70 factor (ECF subfamily)
VRIDALMRAEGGRIVAALIRQFDDFELAEDAAQIAWMRALERWPVDGMPTRPAGWVLTVARRWAIDQLRRQNREQALEGDLSDTPSADLAEPIDEAECAAAEALPDERLRLLFTCCHPALSPLSQVSLALRTLCGLRPGEIARAFLESPSTTAQRLSRARGKIRDARIPFSLPDADALPDRLAAVLAAIYLAFGEGHAATDNQNYVRSALVDEAIRLATLVVDWAPDEPEARGLLALMLLHDARRETRVDADGTLLPLSDQDRTRWCQHKIQAGLKHLDHALTAVRPGRFQIQAAIAALHARAPSAEATDWPQIAGLYAALLRFEPTPVVELNAAVSLAMAHSFERGLEWMDSIQSRGLLANYHLLPAARADLLRRMARWSEAAKAYQTALSRVKHPAERRYLERRLAEMQAHQPTSRLRRVPTGVDTIAPLTDAEWQAIAPLFETTRKRGRPGVSPRLLVDAIRWIEATGRPWRALPDRFGAWKTVYHRQKQWEKTGLWARIQAALKAADEV